MTPKIITTRVRTTGNYEWAAQYEGDNDAAGFGDTEEEAVADLLETYPREEEVMPVWLLEGYSTDGRSDDVRYRDYTTSQKKAEAFRKVPKVQFTDSGHGIVFSARELRPGERRLPKVRTLAEHVQEHMKS